MILDVLLPGRNGFDLCRGAREHGFDGAILMLTARAQVDDRVEGLGAGADDYLIKPFDPKELIARVNALLAPPWENAAHPRAAVRVRRRHRRFRASRTAPCRRSRESGGAGDATAAPSDRSSRTGGLSRAPFVSCMAGPTIHRPPHRGCPHRLVAAEAGTEPTKTPLHCYGSRRRLLV